MLKHLGHDKETKVGKRGRKKERGIERKREREKERYRERERKCLNCNGKFKSFVNDEREEGIKKDKKNKNIIEMTEHPKKIKQERVPILMFFFTFKFIFSLYSFR